MGNDIVPWWAPAALKYVATPPVGEIKGRGYIRGALFAENREPRRRTEQQEGPRARAGLRRAGGPHRAAQAHHHRGFRGDQAGRPRSPQSKPPPPPGRRSPSAAVQGAPAAETKTRDQKETPDLPPSQAQEAPPRAHEASPRGLPALPDVRAHRSPLCHVLQPPHRTVHPSLRPGPEVQAQHQLWVWLA